MSDPERLKAKVAAEEAEVLEMRMRRSSREERAARERRLAERVREACAQLLEDYDAPNEEALKADWHMPYFKGMAAGCKQAARLIRALDLDKLLEEEC